MDIHGIPTNYRVTEPESMTVLPADVSDLITFTPWDVGFTPLPPDTYPTEADAINAAVGVWTADRDASEAALDHVKDNPPVTYNRAFDLTKWRAKWLGRLRNANAALAILGRPVTPPVT